MAVDTQEITAPVNGEGENPEAAGADKSEKVVFDGNYVPDDKGRITVTLTFPAEALGSETWRPVEGILALAGHANLRGYGEGDTPQATVGVGRKQIKGDDGQLKENPEAGRHNGHYSIVIHTEDSLAEARKRGRQAQDPAVKATVTAVSNLVKAALAKPGNTDEIQKIVARIEAGTVDLFAGLEEIKNLQ